MVVPVNRGSCGGREPSHRLVKRLLDQGATSEWSARPLEPKNPLETKRLERTLSTGIVHRTDRGTYWVDEERWRACRTRQLRFAGIAVLGVLLMFAILFVLGEFP
jgi:hypothetical protein